MTLQLQQLPPVAPLMLVALTTVRRRPDENTVVPNLDARINDVRVNSDALAAYREVCGFSGQGGLPTTYPQVLVSPVHLRVMTGKGFPIPLLGMVHLRNHITQSRVIGEDESLSFDVSVSPLRRVKLGLELDVETRCYGGGDSDPCWNSTMTILHRIKESSKSFRKPPGPPQSLLDSKHSCRIDAPENTGRRYARVAADFNPIHLHALSAKLFGFPRAIAHGMWTQARCCAELERALGSRARALDVEFKRPLLLPGSGTLKWAEKEASVEYGMLGKKAGEVHLLGQMQAGLS